MVMYFSESKMDRKKGGNDTLQILREKYFAVLILDILKCPFWVS